MKKHSLIIACILCLALTVFAACTQNQNDPSTETEAETWLCACGEGNSITGKFCSECGTARPGEEAAETTAEATVEATEEPTEETTEEVTDAATDTVAETTEATTEEPTETETRAPRYDYFEADVKADVVIDASLYTDMQLTLPADLKVTDKDVKEYIDYVLFQYRTADNGTTQVTDQPMKLGDTAYIYYKGMIDGKEFDGGSNWDDASPYALGLGSGSFIPGFEEGLVGVIPANATKDTPAEVHVTFPENYQASDLAGKDAVFYVAVMYSIQYTIPAYNRETVETTLQYKGEKDFYASDDAYLTEFEGYVRTYLESQQADEVEYEKLNALWIYLTENATCTNLPQLELDYYHSAYMEEIEYYYNYYKTYGGTTFTETYPTLGDFAKAYMGVGEDGDWEAELNKLCEDMVKKDMITHAIAEIEGMETVSEEEFNTEIQYWVDYYSGYMTKDEILANMGEDIIRSGALAVKMEDWLLSRVTFTYGE